MDTRSVLNELKRQVSLADVKKSEEILAAVSSVICEHKKRYTDSISYLGDSSELTGDVLEHFNETKKKFLDIIDDCEEWQASRDGLLTYLRDSAASLTEDVKKLVKNDILHLVMNAGVISEKSLMCYEMTLNIIKKM